MSIDRLLLMRYHDGELDPEERREVERRLEADPEAAFVLRTYAALGEAVRAGQSAAADVDLTEQIMRGVAAQRTRSVSSWRRAAPIVAASLAVAAGVTLWVLRRPLPGLPPAAVSLATPARGPAPESPSSASARSLPGDTGPAVSIENVEFGEGTGTIFVVAGSEQETPVVWLSDEPGAGSGMEHL